MYPVEECKLFCPSSIPPPGWMGTWTHPETYQSPRPFISSTPSPALIPTTSLVKESGQDRHGVKQSP